MADEVMKEMWRIKDELSARFPTLDAMYRYFEQKPRDSGRNYVTLIKKLKTKRPVRART